MEYFTQGRSAFTDLRLPLVYAPEPILTAPDDRYYAIVLEAEGYLSVDHPAGRHRYPAPVVLYLRPGHAASGISAEGGSAQCCVFKPEAINTTIYDYSSPFELPSIEDFFFFAPFSRTNRSGFAAWSLHASICAAAARLGKELDRSLNTNQGCLWPCMSRSYFLELLILLERSIQGDSLSDGEAVKAPGDPLVLIREYIDAKYREDISLDSLAARFATNRTTLNRKFNESYGMSAMAYVNSVRIAVGASLLRNTMLPVAEVASRAGFSDVSYFARAFKKRYSAAPIEFRKLYPDPYS
jgi:AraC-like DNA-binding protein